MKLLFYYIMILRYFFLKEILDINSKHANKVYSSRPGNNSILNSSTEVEVTNYTGLPLPVQQDQPISIVIKVTGNDVTLTTSCRGTLHNITLPCIIKQSSSHRMIIEIHLRKEEFRYLSYGVHSLFVYTGIFLGQKDQNMRVLLHYENVTDVKVRLSYIVFSC